MRRRKKININPKYLLIACIVLCVSLIIFSFRFGDKLSPVKDAVGTVITPMQKGINTVGTYISDQFEKFKSIGSLLEENENLKNQVAVLSYENQSLLQDKRELEQFRKLYELDQRYIDYPKVAARVISKDPQNWYSTFTIDKGERDGMEKGMNVLAGNGLVGIITEVQVNYSKVRAIIDDNSSVSGEFSDSDFTCIVSGDLQLIDQGKIRVEYIDDEVNLKVGDEVITSKISNEYLDGILIGYISDVEYDTTNTTKIAYLTPVVDFERLEEVLIITELKEPLIDKEK
ncbi:MAG: putative rane protein [Herbinix sp.]|jgi:rod shape-determining protein MreC|nr:putative rane protein [Herbinix sp.]